MGHWAARWAISGRTGPDTPRPIWLHRARNRPCAGCASGATVRFASRRSSVRSRLAPSHESPAPAGFSSFMTPPVERGRNRPGETLGHSLGQWAPRGPAYGGAARSAETSGRCATDTADRSAGACSADSQGGVSCRSQVRATGQRPWRAAGRSRPRAAVQAWRTNASTIMRVAPHQTPAMNSQNRGIC